MSKKRNRSDDTELSPLNLQKGEKLPKFSLPSPPFCTTMDQLNVAPVPGGLIQLQPAVSTGAATPTGPVDLTVV